MVMDFTLAVKPVTGGSGKAHKGTVAATLNVSDKSTHFSLPRRSHGTTLNSWLP